MNRWMHMFLHRSYQASPHLVPVMVRLAEGGFPILLAMAAQRLLGSFAGKRHKHTAPAGRDAVATTSGEASRAYSFSYGKTRLQGGKPKRAFGSACDREARPARYTDLTDVASRIGAMDPESLPFDHSQPALSVFEQAAFEIAAGHRPRLESFELKLVMTSYRTGLLSGLNDSLLLLPDHLTPPFGLEGIEAIAAAGRRHGEVMGGLLGTVPFLSCRKTISEDAFGPRRRDGECRSAARR